MPASTHAYTQLFTKRKRVTAFTGHHGGCDQDGNAGSAPSGHPGTAGAQSRARQRRDRAARRQLRASRAFAEALGAQPNFRQRADIAADGREKCQRGATRGDAAITGTDRRRAGARSQPRTPRRERDPRYGQRGRNKTACVKSCRVPGAALRQSGGGARTPRPGTWIAAGRVARRSPSRTKAPRLAAPRDAAEPRAANIAARKHRGASMRPRCRQRARDEESKSLGDGIAVPTGTLGARKEAKPRPQGTESPNCRHPDSGTGTLKRSHPERAPAVPSERALTNTRPAPRAAIARCAQGSHRAPDLRTERPQLGGTDRLRDGKR